MLDGSSKPAERQLCRKSSMSDSTEDLLRATSDVSSNIGTYLARRMIELGIRDYFVVPGDFNLVLLDQILQFPQLRLISCCNELNAAYAADGYARAKGVAIVFVTFTVGGLSAINAIAGAFAEDLPIIVISGGLNSNDMASNRIIHHTTGLPSRFQASKCFNQVTAKVEVILHPETAASQLDDCILAALQRRKPVYVEIACNIAAEGVHKPIPFGRQLAEFSSSDEANQEAAVAMVVKLFTEHVKPVIIIGPKVRMFRKRDYRRALVALAENSGCAVAVQPAAKGLFPETHPNYIGTYWGTVSHEFTCETVESCDLFLCIGTVWTDYSTVGYSLHCPLEKRIEIEPQRVKHKAGDYSFLHMVEFVEALANVIPSNGTSLKVYNHMKLPPRGLPPRIKDEGLESRVLAHHVQELLDKDKTLFVETGDAWFHGQKMTLPDGCGYEFQMQYGSIGWSVGAVLGYALATQGRKRVIAMIGDGSFQCTAQEISTMIRYETNPIIFLLNNDGYTIEVEIHDGEYNNIQRWKYAAIVDVFNGHKGGKGWSAVVRSEGELVAAIEHAKEHDGVCLIECMLERDDCTKELLEWGTRVAAANGRKYQEM